MVDHLAFLNSEGWRRPGRTLTTGNPGEVHSIAFGKSDSLLERCLVFITGKFNLRLRKFTLEYEIRFIDPKRGVFGKLMKSPQFSGSRENQGKVYHIERFKEHH